MYVDKDRVHLILVTLATFTIFMFFESFQPQDVMSFAPSAPQTPAPQTPAPQTPAPQGPSFGDDSTNATNETIGEFRTSEKPIDTELTMRIQYPSNYELQPADFFAFTALLEPGEKVSSEQGRILQIEKFASSGSPGNLCSIYTKACWPSAENYLQQQSDNFTTNFSNYTLIEGPTDIKIAGNPAKKSIFQCSTCYALIGLIPTPPSPGSDAQKLLEITTVDEKSGNVILIEISIKEGKYPQFPPSHIQKMIDSIEFVSSQSTAGQPGQLESAVNTTSQ